MPASRPNVYDIVKKDLKSLRSGVQHPGVVLVNAFRAVSTHYRTGASPPNFADPWNRLAYGFSCIPVGIDAFGEVFRLTFQHPATGSIPTPFGMFSPGNDLTVVSIGTGPGTEFLAMIEYLSAGPERRMVFHAFDGEVAWEQEARALVEAWSAGFKRPVSLTYRSLTRVGLQGELDELFEWEGWSSPAILTAFRFTKWMEDDLLREWFAQVTKVAPEDAVVILADAKGGGVAIGPKHDLVVEELMKTFPNSEYLLPTTDVTVSNMSWQVPDPIKKIAMKAQANPPVGLTLTATSLWLRK